ncbi:MAG TPA: hypothetical protein DDW50_11975, partial [Firmicutes bacterium]|nr:hypothetical protein [Bacillota bacterium]
MEMKVKSQGLGKIWPVALLALGIILAISGSYSAALDISNDQSDALHGEENMLKGMSLEEKIGQMFM